MFTRDPFNCTLPSTIVQELADYPTELESWDTKITMKSGKPDRFSCYKAADDLFVMGVISSPHNVAQDLTHVISVFGQLRETANSVYSVHLYVDPALVTTAGALVLIHFWPAGNDATSQTFVRGPHERAVH
jgi:hypothetical protein